MAWHMLLHMHGSGRSVSLSKAGSVPEEGSLARLQPEDFCWRGFYQLAGLS